MSHSAFLTAIFVVLTTEEGLKNNGNGTPDIAAASNPDTAPSPAIERGQPTNGQAEVEPPARLTKKEKVYFSNGEVKSILLLPIRP